MNKKADVEVQFNWMFVMIAGGIILLFFFTIISGLREGAETSIETNVQGDMRTTLVGVKVSNSITDITVPRLGLNLDCDGLKIGNGQGVKLGPMFGPRKFQGGELLTWSHDWDMPMRLENFVYISDSNHKYVVVDQYSGGGALGGFAQDLVSELPEEGVEFATDCTDLTNFVPQGSESLHVVEILQGVSPNCAPQNLNYPGTHIHINPTNPQILDLDDVLSQGEVTIRELGVGGPSPQTWDYYGAALVYGAIYAGDAEIYECMYRQAFSRGALTYEVFIERTGELSNAYSSSCSDLSAAVTDIEEIQDDFRDIAAGTPAPDLPTNVGNLRVTNNQLLIQSCAGVY